MRVGVPMLPRKTQPQRHPRDFLAAKSVWLQQFILNSSNHQKRLKRNTVPIMSGSIKWVFIVFPLVCCVLHGVSCYLSTFPSFPEHDPGTWALKKGRKDEDCRPLHIFLGSAIAVAGGPISELVMGGFFKKYYELH